MTDEFAPKIDADTLELIERRLSEKIEADIRGRLFKSYLGLGAVVLAILGYVGFNITSQIKTDIESTFNNTFVSKFQDKMDAIKDKATMIDVLTDATQRNALNLQTVADAAKPQIALIETYASQVQDLNSKTKDLQSSLLVQSASYMDKVNKLSDQISALALEVQKLADATDKGLTVGSPPQEAAQQVAISSAGISSSSKAIQSTIAAVKKPSTVFLQYAMPKETAQAIAKQLGDQGFLIPGIDSEASAAGLNEVRYYYDGDRPAAAILADAASKILHAAIPGAPAVNVRSLTDWPNRKPNPGTLELWVSSPQTAAAR